MTIRKERHGPVTLLRLQGDLNAEGLARATEAVEETLNESPARFVFDVGEIKIATSITLGFLACAAKRAREAGGKVVLSRPSRLMLETISMLQFDRLFEHFESVDDAIACAAAEASQA